MFFDKPVFFARWETRTFGWLYLDSRRREVHCIFRTTMRCPGLACSLRQLQFILQLWGAFCIVYKARVCIIQDEFHFLMLT